MQRPIGVTLLAAGAVIAALYEVWRMLVFMGIVSFNFVGKEVSFNGNPQWGQVLWALLLAAIWLWVAAGFWNVRAYAWSFGIFISLFTLFFGFMALLFGSTVEAETVPWLLAGAIFLYLNYPGVQNAFMEHEMSLLTPEQRAALKQVQAANAAAAAAMQAPGMQSAPSATSPTPPATPPAAPPPAAPGS